MLWRFTIIDRNNRRTIIDEPNGWADFSAKLKRHPQRHGTFREIQGNNFQFFEKGAWIIREEYKAYGANGQMQLLIEQQAKRGWYNFYQGIFSFPSYKSSFELGVGFYVTCDVDQSGPVVDLINRFDQSVDITKSKSFDGTTDLTNYPFLNFDMVLPSKSIYTRAEAVTTNNPSPKYDIVTDINFVMAPTFTNNGIIIPKFEQTDIQEIKNFRPSQQFDFIDYTSSKPLADQIESFPILELQPDSALQGLNTYQVNMKFKGSLITKYHQIGIPSSGTGTITVALKLSVRCLYGSAKTDLFVPVVIDNFSDIRVAGQPDVTHTTPIDFTYTASFSLNRNEKVWPFLQLESSNISNSDFAPWISMEIAFTEESYFKINSYTKADDTSCKVWMVNECTSRVIESITDNRLRLFSEYFGRNNSAPFSFTTNGCGSERILTNGLHIRQVRLADGTIPSVFMSLKDIFEALAATDNIGMGPEGENTLRIENWKWFYKNNVVHRCIAINKIDRVAQESEIYSTFNCGYDKWEAEDYNGLDEYMTRREFRLDIPQVKNPLEQICKFVTSGYATEVTRRKLNTSTDWRYDNNIFMICVEPDGGSYKVELDNILSPANMIEPATIYNFRLTPTRNAMRWFDKVIGSYRNVNTGHRIIFAKADGNYIAEGELAGPDCKLEAGVIRENQDLSITDFDDQAEALPIMWPERVKFSYPLGANEYKNIQSNPYGLIEFTSPADSGFGWIDEINYKPNEGIADFTLIPKID